MKLRILSSSVVCLLLAVSLVHNANSTTRSNSVFLYGAPIERPQAFPTLPKRPFDVRKYDLTLDWRHAFEIKSQQFAAKNSITLRLLDAVPSIMLDAALMTIDTVTVNGVAVSPVPQPDTNETLVIPIDASFRQVGTDIVVSIAYHRTNTTQRGAYFYPKGQFVGTLNGNDTVRIAEDIMYTMSEPLDARSWMPCVDLPYDKADADITIIAPNGITTASNGDLIEKTAYDANSTRWHWRSDRPIATYLMVADASVYTVWSDTYHRLSNPADTVPLVYYAWPEDYLQDSITDGSWYNARHSFRNTASIMSIFESRYGDYPFKKYGQVVLQQFWAGGQEHQSITSVNRVWIRTDDEQGMAHEMAHHWFGDKVTCETFKDIWLNEGFATFSEAIWTEGWGGDGWYVSTMQNAANQYLYSNSADSTVPIYDPPGADDMFGLPTTLLFYSKAGSVIHMLRRQVNNDALFFKALRDYTDSFAYSTATTEDFKRVMSSELGMDLTEFIDEWIYGPGHPVYDIGWGQSPSGMLNVHIVQSQTTRDHFTMPVRFFVYHGTQKDTIVLQNTQRDQLFTQSYPYTIDSLGFDNEAVILNFHQLHFDPQLSVPASTNTVASELHARYDNGSSSILCSVTGSQGSTGRLDLVDMLGRTLRTLTLGAGIQEGTLSTSDIADGVYLVRYVGDESVLTTKVRVAR